MLEVVQYTKNDRRLIVEGRTIPRRDRNGNTAAMLLQPNITERKQSEAEMRETEARFKHWFRPVRKCST